MPISNKTRSQIGLPEKAVEEPSLGNALGVQATVLRRPVSEELSKAEKAERDLLQSRALTIEDDPWNELPNERRVNLIKHSYDPVLLVNLTLQNNTLGQCIDAMEVNVDGSGFDIEPRDGEAVEGEDDPNIEGIKQFFDTAYINESFTSIRRKMRRDLESTGNAYLEVIRDASGDITLLNHLDAKLVRLVRLDDPVPVEREVLRNGSVRKVKMQVRERRYAQLIGNKVRYFREFGSSREVNSETGEWLGEAKRVGSPQFQATLDQDKGDDNSDKRPPFGAKPGEEDPEAMPMDAEAEESSEGEEFPKKKKPNPFQKIEKAGERTEQPELNYSTAPTPEDDPTHKPMESMVNAPLGTEVIAFKCKPDVTTPYGLPRWINQIPSTLGSRKAEELNLEFFNNGGVPPVMIFLQGGQLTPGSRTELNKYLSGEAKHKLRAVIADVYSTGGDLSSNSQVKVNVERFGSGQNDSMFEGYDDKCSSRVRSAFRMPPLFTGDTGEYNFATAYASYVVAEAQVFKPERELFDEIINNTLMKEIAPDYIYRSLPLTVHDVAVQLQALTLIKDVADRDSFLSEVNEIAGLTVAVGDPMTDPMSPANPDSPMNPLKQLEAKGGVPGQNPFGGKDTEDEEPSGKAPPFGAKPAGKEMPAPVGIKKPAKPAGFAKADIDRVMKMGDETITRLAEDWAAHLSGDRTFEAPTINFMKSIIEAFDPKVRKLFNAYVGIKLAPGAKYDPDGVSDLIACAGDCLHG
jgi:PBSX family phage portal protein